MIDVSRTLLMSCINIRACQRISNKVDVLELSRDIYRKRYVKGSCQCKANLKKKKFLLVPSLHEVYVLIQLDFVAKDKKSLESVFALQCMLYCCTYELQDEQGIIQRVITGKYHTEVLTVRIEIVGDVCPKKYRG